MQGLLVLAGAVIDANLVTESGQVSCSVDHLEDVFEEQLISHIVM